MLETSGRHSSAGTDAAVVPHMFVDEVTENRGPASPVPSFMSDEWISSSQNDNRRNPWTDPHQRQNPCFSKVRVCFMAAIWVGVATGLISGFVIGLGQERDESAANATTVENGTGFEGGEMEIVDPPVVFDDAGDNSTGEDNVFDQTVSVSSSPSSSLSAISPGPTQSPPVGAFTLSPQDTVFNPPALFYPTRSPASPPTLRPTTTETLMPTPIQSLPTDLSPTYVPTTEPTDPWPVFLPP